MDRTCRRTAEPRPSSTVQTQWADRRELQCGHGGIDTDIEAEDSQLEPLLGGDEDAGNAIDRDLETRAAGSLGKPGAAGQEILADRIRWQVEAKLGHLAGYIGRESVAVWAGPGTILVRIGIAGSRCTHRFDHRIDIRSTPVEYDLRSGAEPVVVGAHPVDAHGGGAVGDTKAEHLVTRVAAGPGRFHG